MGSNPAGTSKGSVEAKARLSSAVSQPDPWFHRLAVGHFRFITHLSSRGQGRKAFNLATRVRIPLGAPVYSSVV